MKGRSLTYSVVFHGVVLAALMINLPWSHRHEIPSPPAIMVEFAELDKVTQTNKIGDDQKIEKEQPKEAPAKPAPAPQNTNTAPVAPPVEAPKEPPKETVKAQPETDEAALPDKAKKKEKPEENKKPAANDFASVLRNLAATKDQPTPKAPDMKLDEKGKVAQGFNAPIGEKVTISEEGALRQQLEACWNVPIGARDVENTIVEIRLEVNPDRTLRSATILDQSRYNSDSFYRAIADSAMRAVRNPNCSPLALPPDKFDAWKTTVVTFNPKDMF